MDGLDKFEEPTYSASEIKIGGEGFGDKVGAVKKFVPYIIAIVVLAAIALFAYDFFIGSVSNVSIAVKDTEGEALGESSIKLFAAGADQPFFTGSDASTYTVAMRTGSYRAEATAPGYAIKTAQIELGANENQKTIELEKDFDVEITGFEQAFPAKLFLGQATTVPVTVQNKSDKSATVQLMLEDGLKELVAQDETGAVTIAGNSSAAINIAINVKTSIKIKNEKDGDSKKAVVRVKYTKKQESHNFTLFPNPADKITLGSATFSVKAREGLNKQSKKIKVTNSNKFSIEDLNLSIEITSSTANDEAQVLQWFQFTEIADEPKPQLIGIQSIAAASSVEKELQVIAPLSAKKEPGIKGNIVLSAGYLQQPKKTTLTLEIAEEASYGIALSLTPNQPYEIAWDDTKGKYEKKIVTLKVKNSGQAGLQNIFLTIENEDDCSTNWLSFLESTPQKLGEIDSLAVGQTRELKMEATAPIAQRGNETSMYCSMHYRFDNPVQLGEYVEDTMPAFIQIRPEAE